VIQAITYSLLSVEALKLLMVWIISEGVSHKRMSSADDSIKNIAVATR